MAFDGGDLRRPKLNGRYIGDGRYQDMSNYADNAFESEKYRDHTINLRYDKYPTTPRDWSNLGVIIAFHRYYDLIDNQRCFDYQSLLRIISPYENQTIDGWLLDCGVDFALDVVLPIFSYGDIELSCDGKHGALPVGAIVCTYETIMKEYDIDDARPPDRPPGIFLDISEFFGEEPMDPDADPIPNSIRDTVIKCLKEEVLTYSQYLNGDVFSWEVLDDVGNCIDGCSGYYGCYDSAEVRYAVEQAMSLIDELCEDPECNDFETKLSRNEILDAL